MSFWIPINLELLNIEKLWDTELLVIEFMNQIEIIWTWILVFISFMASTIHRWMNKIMNINFLNHSLKYWMRFFSQSIIIRNYQVIKSIFALQQISLDHPLWYTSLIASFSFVFGMFDDKQPLSLNLVLL